MQTKKLNSGYEIPVLGLGTWKSLNGTAGPAVEYALTKAGYTHIDCASIYRNEKEIGEAFSNSFKSGIKREDIFITSKLWNTDHRAEFVEEACRQTLKDLQLEYVDLYLMHWGVAFPHTEDLEAKDKNGNAIIDTVSIRETWEAMQELVKKGLVKSIGVANFTTMMLFDLLSYAKMTPAANQIELHPYNTQQDLVDFCNRKGIAVTAYSPLGRQGADRKGKTSSAKTGKKRGIFFFITRYFLFFSVALLFFAGTTAYFHWSSSQPTCANSKSCTSDLTQHIENGVTGVFHGKTVIPPTISSTQQIAYQPVLGADANSGEKHIYVDLAKQTLYAYQGTTLFMKTLVATGKWGKTPVGNFHIWEKLVATRMAGGEGADAYDLPNVPYVMYFYHDFGLHGAYWHDNFGHTMSHGCVNMRQVDAKTLFDWADAPQGNELGTAVSVCNEITGQNQCIQDNPVN